jgi:hypothetical protein
MGVDYSGFAFPKPSRREEKQAIRREDRAAEAACYRAVDRRDGYACRLCGKRGRPESPSLLDRLHHHHNVLRSKGGAHDTRTVFLVCAGCHDLLHKHRLRVTGDADVPQGLTVERLVGHTYQTKGTR